MRGISRRQLLVGAVGMSAPALFEGCSSESNGFVPTGDDAGVDALVDAFIPDTATAGPCANPFAGGEYLGNVPFAYEDGPLEIAFGEGLNGRLYTDLAKLEPDALVTSNETH